MKMENGYPYIRRETYEFIRDNFTIDDVDIVLGKSLIGTRYKDKDGYDLVTYKSKVVREHHIIAYFIFGERMVGKQINHIDLCKSNNKPSNLEIVTASENIRHSFNCGLRKPNIGNSSKFTETDIVNIREKRRNGATLKELGDEYGVAFQSISRICNYDRWGHVPNNLDLVDMDFDKFQLLSQRTVNSSLSDYDEVANYALGLISECSEVCDEVKKQLFHGHDIDRDKIKDELSDVMWYMANLARKYDLTLKEIAVHNVEKLLKRYPEGFEESKSIDREL